MFNKTDIKGHMEILGSDGLHVGTVDHLEGSSDIKLTKSDPKSGGQHHLIPLATTGPVKTAIADVALLCPTCHRVAHRIHPWPSVAEMR